jgi:hypothetical protein
MQLLDVTIVEFHFFPGVKGPSIRAMVQFHFDEVREPVISWVELQPQEAQKLVNIARLIEHRLKSGEYPVPEEVKRQIGFRKPEP